MHLKFLRMDETFKSTKDAKNKLFNGMKKIFNRKIAYKKLESELTEESLTYKNQSEFINETLDISNELVFHIPSNVLSDPEPNESKILPPNKTSSLKDFAYQTDVLTNEALDTTNKLEFELPNHVLSDHEQNSSKILPPDNTSSSKDFAIQTDVFTNEALDTTNEHELDTYKYLFQNYLEEVFFVVNHF